MDQVEEFLEHFGIKGMRWGVRRAKTSGGKTSTSKSHPGHSSDAARAQDYHARAKTSGTHSLSNQELQHLVSRMNLEQQYSRLTSSSKGSSKAKKGHGFVKEILGVGTTAKQAYDLVNSSMAKDIKKALNKSKS